MLQRMGQKLQAKLLPLRHPHPGAPPSPLTQVIHEHLGIDHGCITTIHNLTNTQTLVDAPNTKKTDLRRAR